MKLCAEMYLTGLRGTPWRCDRGPKEDATRDEGTMGVPAVCSPPSSRNPFGWVARPFEGSHPMRLVLEGGAVCECAGGREDGVMTERERRSFVAQMAHISLFSPCLCNQAHVWPAMPGSHVTLPEPQRLIGTESLLFPRAGN